MNSELIVYFLEWLATNTTVAVQLLSALVPVLALGVAAYAIHAVIARERKGRK